MFLTKAKVQVKNDKGAVVASQEYDKTVFEGTGLDDKGNIVPGDAETLLGQAIQWFQEQVGEKGNGVVELLKNATYANDLGKRATIRQMLVAAVAGPEKAIEKSIKDFMAARAAAGKPISEEKARAKVLAMMED